MKSREPAVAGSFYPNNPAQLQMDITALLDGIPEFKNKPKALIVPHAGYCYSGAVAAKAYRYLNKIKHIKKVILLGPSHRVALQGCAVPSHQYFTTPLGQVKVDATACQHLVDKGLASCSDQAHQWEHSLEVQLPFLQQCLDDFELIPVVVGESNPEQVSRLLTELARIPATLIVVSTDLSHFHQYENAQRLDDATIDRILALDSSIQGHNACGCNALNGLLDFCKQQQWQIKLINKANSADISDQTLINKERVVGYASFILY